jgi:hypothetical protein
MNLVILSVLCLLFLTSYLLYVRTKFLSFKTELVVIEKGLSDVKSELVQSKALLETIIRDYKPEDTQAVKELVKDLYPKVGTIVEISNGEIWSGSGTKTTIVTIIDAKGDVYKRDIAHFANKPKVGNSVLIHSPETNNHLISAGL